MYGDWFMKRIEEGWGIKYNPYNQKVNFVSLKPGDVGVLVFWSKNYHPFIEHLDKLDRKGYNLFFHYTITGLPRRLEKNIPDIRQSIETFKIISRNYSPKQIVWRFDPIMPIKNYNLDKYLSNFSFICRELKGYTESCYISFANIYGKVLNRLKIEGINLIDVDKEKKKDFARQLAEVAEGNNIKVFSCCNNFLISEKVQRARCIDVNLYGELFDINPHMYKKSPSRKECGCFESVDIGLYDTCTNKCLYCYANNNERTILNNLELHDHNYAALHKGIDIERAIIEKKYNNQISIYDLITEEV